MVDIVDKFFVLFFEQILVDFILGFGDPLENAEVFFDVVEHPVLVLEGAAEVGLVEFVVDVVPDFEPFEPGVVHAGQHALPHLVLDLVGLEAGLAEQTPDAGPHVFPAREVADLLVQMFFHALLELARSRHGLQLFQLDLVESSFAQGVTAFVVLLGDQLQLVVLVVVELQVVDTRGGASNAGVQVPDQLFGGQQRPFVVGQDPVVVSDPQAFFLVDEGLEEYYCASVAGLGRDVVVPVVQGLFVVHEFDQDADADAFEFDFHALEGLDHGGHASALHEVQFRAFVADDRVHHTVQYTGLVRKQVEVFVVVALHDDLLALAAAQNFNQIFDSVLASELLLAAAVVVGTELADRVETLLLEFESDVWKRYQVNEILHQAQILDFGV
mmetsp:Transcript_106672/g.229686  ORF Transcript_106672/g.229686 Transcript_106672/m.229686 type:complete len:385 (-) Transcript_106672:343-1497(-)